MPVFPADARHLDEAADRLRQGQLVAFPTETVYGLGANALSPEAVRGIYRAKGRPAFNPLIVHVAGAQAARHLVQEWPAAAQKLAEQFWPGPLTLVLPRRDNVPDEVTAGGPTVAVRMPGHPVALELLRRCGLPLAAPSANRSNSLSPTTAHHVLHSLGEECWVLDGGACSYGIESTVVSLAGEGPLILRPGALEAARVEAVIGPLSRPRAGGNSGSLPSPGMLARHYAPEGEVLLFQEREEARLLFATRAAGRKTGVLAFAPAGLGELEIIMPSQAGAYAARLYDALHQLEDAGCRFLLIEAVPDTAAWTAIRDRLARAAMPLEP
jgi:L-threonylcarbamoyladenylate synthase